MTLTQSAAEYSQVFFGPVVPRISIRHYVGYDRFARSDAVAAPSTNPVSEAITTR
jgi:hypothetical protein